MARVVPMGRKPSGKARSFRVHAFGVKIARRQSARKSSDEIYDFNSEVSGPPEVGRIQIQNQSTFQL